MVLRTMWGTISRIKKGSADIWGKHPIATTGRAICPYCFSTFANIANLKIHIRDRICPNHNQEFTPENRGEIIRWGPIALDPKENKTHHRYPISTPEIKKPNRYIGNELLLDRIARVTQDNKSIWQCRICHRRKTKFNAIKSRMAIIHCEITHKEMYFPYCNKKNKRLFNRKRHISSRKCQQPRPNITPETWQGIVQRNPPG